MYTEIDERHGVVRSTWKDVRDRVRVVNPEFTKLVDELSPDDFALYVLYLPYGQLVGDVKTPFLHSSDKKIYRLSSPELPKKLINELGYGMYSAPLGMVLEKNLEYYIDIPKLNLTLPRYVTRPGSIFPLSMLFKNNNKTNYAPSGILNLISGCRSTFMLPHICSKLHYEKLQYDYNLKSPRPENLYQHFDIFKELASAAHIKEPWQSCIIYFSQEWVEKILNDSAWYKVKMYLWQQGLKLFIPETHRHLLDFVFSYIQIIKNLKPNPYIVDTARHIINTAIGSVPGYAPASNEEYLPVSAIETPFIESYGMKKYFPTILHPEQLLVNSFAHPIYYSLQYPATHSFSPKSRTASSMLVEMRELATVIKIFLENLSSETSYCRDTIYSDISKYLNITCLHNQDDKHGIIQLSNQISNYDERFSGNYCYQSINDQEFASDGKFFRGCVMISSKT